MTYERGQEVKVKGRRGWHRLRSPFRDGIKTGWWALNVKGYVVPIDTEHVTDTRKEQK